MKKIICIIAVVTLAAFFVSFVHAADVITIRLSYKVVLNPANGNRPPGVTDNDIDVAIAAMNALEESYFRGFRFQRVDPVTNIGGQGNVNGPSRWYNTDFFEDRNAKDNMENDALNNPGVYAWNANAINIYITNFDGRCGGICSFPGDNDEIIIIAACTDGDGATQLHEIGHYFNLFHTQGDVCGCCESGETGKCHTEPGDDKVADTLPDLACWDRDGIANWTYKNTYANLNDDQQKLVDDVFLNIMSYHGSNCGQGAVPTRMTEGQLDRWTDAANDDRRGVANGRTWFVGTPTSGFGNGTSGNPFLIVNSAQIAANPQGGDMILLKPGAHRPALLSNRLVLNKPLTLRATRAGAAVIGASSTSSPVVTQSSEDIDAALRQIPGIVSDRSHLHLDFAGFGGEKTDQR
jgi:hypothetical protein